MVGAERSDVYEDGMGVALYLILLSIFVEEVLGYFICLFLRIFTFSLVMISSSSRLTWKRTYFEETLP